MSVHLRTGFSVSCMCFGECMWCVTSETATDSCDCYSTPLSQADLRCPVHRVHHGDLITHSRIDGLQYDTDCAIPVVNLFQFRKRAPYTSLHKQIESSRRKSRCVKNSAEYLQVRVRTPVVPALGALMRFSKEHSSNDTWNQFRPHKNDINSFTSRSLHLSDTVYMYDNTSHLFVKTARMICARHFVPIPTPLAVALPLEGIHTKSGLIIVNRMT